MLNAQLDENINLTSFILAVNDPILNQSSHFSGSLHFHFFCLYIICKAVKAMKSQVNLAVNLSVCVDNVDMTKM